MKFTLRDYQRQAAIDVLKNLRRGLDAYHQYDSRSSFSLSALTGAGKTVIATAVIEALLHGSADLEAEPAPRAAFLWVTDDPALNRQTADRMLQASDSIAPRQLVIIDDTFDQRSFAPGAVYFLNTQKLASSASYVKSGVDGREYSIWDTVSNTVHGSNTDLVMVLDEAHKGMKPAKDKKSIVRQLIDGVRSDERSAVPIVWGISATVERFEEAMKGTSGRDHLTSVIVDNDLIRMSGLVKDRIVLDNPNEEGTFDTTLLREAVNELEEMSRRWAAYTSSNNLPDVSPVMVIQVPDKASPAKFSEVVGIVTEEWQNLPDEAFVHVLSDHTGMKAAGRDIRYISPERIQDDQRVQFVLAKEAITTGWDCPRAEVLYSERPARDETHIAQLIGRIVRTPLASRPLGDERLSEVSCYLPNFHRDAVDKVVARLESGDDAVTVAAVRKTGDFKRVPSFEEMGVYDLLASTPCEPAPSTTADPIRRAKSMATHLAGDGFVEDAGAQLTARLNARLAGLAAEHREVVKANVHDILHAERLQTVYTYAGGSDLERRGRQSLTDATNIADAYRVMSRRIKEGVVEDYRRSVARTVESNGDEVDMLEIQSEVAALLMVPGVVEAVEQTADGWTKSQLEATRVARLSLGQEQMKAYLDIEGQAKTPELVAISLPQTATATVADAKGEPVDRWQGHVYQDADGMYSAKLNEWERQVVRVESQRPDFVGWYRNPSTASNAALRIAYRDGDTWKSLQPDFIVVSKLNDGTLVRSIVDPHGDHLADALPKLKALAAYAEEYAEELHRVESLTMVDNELRVLDLKNSEVRAAVDAFDEDGSINSLYAGALSYPFA